MNQAKIGQDSSQLTNYSTERTNSLFKIDNKVNKCLYCKKKKKRIKRIKIIVIVEFLPSTVEWQNKMPVIAQK